MGGLSKLKGMMQSAFDTILPPIEDDLMDLEEDLVNEESSKPAVQKAKVETASYKVAGGSPVYVSRGADTTDHFAHASYSQRPQLTVHTNKSAVLKVQIYAPQDFDQVTAIADDIKSGKAAVVNYERIDASEQRRICDFVNGVCYVMNGCAKRISEQIVLYVPDGVDVADCMPIALTD